jgi:hypothetical protein
VFFCCVQIAAWRAVVNPVRFSEFTMYQHEMPWCADISGEFFVRGHHDVE